MRLTTAQNIAMLVICGLLIVVVYLWHLQSTIIDAYAIRADTQAAKLEDLNARLLSVSVDFDACRAELADLKAHPRLPALPGTESLGE